MSSKRVLVSLDRWLLAPAPATRLAGLRIAVAGFVTIYLVANVGEFARLADRSPAEFDPLGLARLLEDPLPAPALWAGFAILVALGLAVAAGVAYRITAPLFALGVLGWASYHSSWGQLLHFEHLFTLHLLILALAPAADAWSLPAHRQRDHRPLPEADTRYGWPIRLLAITTAVTYVLSGIAKLDRSGLGWFDPDTLSNHIAYSATRIELVGGTTPPLAVHVVGRPWLVAPMAAAALAVELGAPVALRAGTARNLWVAAAICFHLGTAATMMVFFGYRGLGIAMLPLFAVERLPTQVTKPARGASQPTR